MRGMETGTCLEIEQPMQAQSTFSRPAAVEASGAEPELVSANYLLITGIHCAVDAAGRRWVDEMWHKDLLEHLKYLPSFTLACPVKYGSPAKSDVCVSDHAAYASVNYVDLPYTASLLVAMYRTPQTLARLWKAVGNSDIVHMGIAGWPIPMGLLAMPISKMRGRKTVVVVESSPWRIGRDASLRARIRGAVNERCGRWCVNSADLPLFTQRSYQQELLTRRPEQGHVVHASWIDEDRIVSDAAAAELWRRRLREPGRFRVIVVGRLTKEKGIRVLLQAMGELGRRGVAIELDVLGSGPLGSECERAARELTGSAKVRMLGSVPYGPEFFNLLGEYQALVAPLLSDEQPRIVYDAFARALPVIGTTAAGMLDCVTDKQTGKLCTPGDVAALADLLQWASEHPDALSQLGYNGVRVARGLTHQEMHRKRSVWLNELLRATAPQTAG